MKPGLVVGWKALWLAYVGNVTGRCDWRRFAWVHTKKYALDATGLECGVAAIGPSPRAMTVASRPGVDARYRHLYRPHRASRVSWPAGQRRRKPGDVAISSIALGKLSFGVAIGPRDTVMASHALSINATIVTNNVREFSRRDETARREPDGITSIVRRRDYLVVPGMS